MSKKRIIQIVVLPFILTIWLWIGTLWLASWPMAININLCPEGMVLINGGTYKLDLFHLMVKEIYDLVSLPKLSLIVSLWMKLLMWDMIREPQLLISTKFLLHSQVTCKRLL